MDNTDESVFKTFRKKYTDRIYYCKCGEIVREINGKWEHYGMDGMSESQGEWDKRTDHPIEIMIIDHRVRDFRRPYRPIGY